MSTGMEINPVDQLDALKALFRDVKIEIHYPGDTSEEFKYLADDNVCITVLNPYQDEKMYIDLGDEFTLSYGMFHSHYFAEDSEYENMVADIRNILQNKMCVASIYHYGSRKKCLGSTIVTRDMMSRPIKETFHFVLKFPEFKKKVADYGGEAQFFFWNPADNRTIDIPERS